MDISPVTLEGRYVRLEPLTPAHRDDLIRAASDGELWNLKTTVVPSADTAGAYIEEAMLSQSRGRHLPFVIRDTASGLVVGSTRYRDIRHSHRGLEIGNTWLSASAQRTAINTEAKLLLLTHAFEKLDCIRVEFYTDMLNVQSRAAIARLGAKQEGILRNHLIMPDGRYRDSICFSIIAGEWPEVKAHLIQRLNTSQSEQVEL